MHDAPSATPPKKDTRGILPEGPAYYEKAEDLLKLVLKMQGKEPGFTLQDIQLTCGVGRRTAERMRDAIVRLFPQTEEIVEGRRKYWYIPDENLIRMITISADELAHLRSAIDLLWQHNCPDEAAALESIERKLRALTLAEKKSSSSPHDLTSPT